MAALASSLIRQKRAVKEDQANRPIANKRKPCPKSNKSLCQKQILVLISKVRLCGGRRGRTEKRPGRFILNFSLLEPNLPHKKNRKITAFLKHQKSRMKKVCATKVAKCHSSWLLECHFTITLKFKLAVVQM